MPADSEPDRPARPAGPATPVTLPPLPRTWRPVGPRVVGIAITICVAAICVGAAIALGPETRAKFTGFQIGTLVFMALLAGALMWTLLRSRATATNEGLLVVNGWKQHQLSWPEIVAVRLPPGAPWVTMDLADGTTLSVLAIQASDGERAKVAARQIGALSHR